MEMKVSCSLDGRDLAIVKSLININNIYGNLVIQFVEDARFCQVLIAKDYHNHGSVYYAMNRVSGEKTYIKPELNPKTVRALFEQLSRKMQAEEQRLDTSGLFSIEQLVLKHTQSSSNHGVMIEHQDQVFIMDKQHNLLYTNHPIDEGLISQLSQADLSAVKFSVIQQAPSNREFKFKESLDLFKWQLGFCQQDHLIHAAHAEYTKAFKQIHWPNYGELPAHNEFIRLSSMLWKRSETYMELIEHSGYEKSLINQFLNATLMAGNVVVVDSASSQESRVVKNSSPFLAGLKKLFKFK